MSNESPIACDMSVLSPAQRELHICTSRELFSSLNQIRELLNGYEFRLEGSNVIVKAAEFISLEKLCWLKLSGREGVKAFLREEISGLLGTTINWSDIHSPTS